MYIDNPHFPHRKIVNSKKYSQYEPKKRWDQGTFGTERNSMLEYVQNTLKSHQNDAQMLQKFRREAQQYKLQKRKQKFPHLYENPFKPKKQQPFVREISTPILIKDKKYNANPEQYHQGKQQFNTLSYIDQSRKRQRNSIQFQPIPVTSQITPNHFFELQARLQYQRLLAQKDIQIFKRQQKIKNQKKEIKKLYHRIKSMQKQDELQKYVQAQEQMKKITNMLADVKQQFQSKKLIPSKKNQSLPLQSYPSIQHRQRNKSQLILKNQDKISPVNYQNDQQGQAQNYNLGKSRDLTSNPSVAYSPSMQKNKSSVFKNVPLYDKNKNKHSLNDYIEQLKGNHKRIDHLQRINNMNYNKI